LNLTVSIIIPCRNEEAYIAKCLDSIVNCSYDKSLLSVFVCDGLSTDKTVEIIQEYSKMHPFIKLLINSRQTTQYALNLGIVESDADIKIILGAHAEIYPDYIDKCIEILSLDKEIGCAGGIIENISENEISEVIASAMSSGFGVGNAHFRTGGKEGYVDTVAFGAYKKEVFEKAGLFDEDLIRNQDDEFNFRVIKAGFKIYLSHKIHSKYYVRASLKKLFNQYYQYGYWKVYVNKKHKTVTTIRQMIPMLFVLFLFSGVLASLFSKHLLLAYAFVLLIYITGGLYSAIRVNRAKAIMVMQVFFILHFSYGLGYLEGIFNFLILGRKASLSSTVLTR
jgi:glycosyltransferase involved in cell wall biosynthesis